MEDFDDSEFQSGEAGASESFPMQCSALRKGGYVLIKDRPCKIVDMSTSKTGKHGHAKVNLVGIDIFTGRKYEDISPSTHNMSVPNVVKKEYTLLDIDEDKFCTLMSDDNETREDIKLPDGDLGDDIQNKFENQNDADNIKCVVLKAMGEEHILAVKVEINKA